MTEQQEKQMQQFRKKVQQIKEQIAQRIVGQEELIESLLIVLLEGGHLLVEGIPGLAKTLTVKSFADLLQAKFQRIQFTPDLLPADLIGTEIFRQGSGEFVPRKGPIFTQVLLADEINRAPAKVQSALLEVMQERQVTIGSQTYQLEQPFLVMATQNPIEEEGTYQLPAAQIDRFTMKVVLDYPSAENELNILQKSAWIDAKTFQPLLEMEQLKTLQTMLKQVHVEESIQRYIVTIAQASRPQNYAKNDYNELIRYLERGISPRATIALCRCAMIHALFDGRFYVIPEDVKHVAKRVMRHRLLLSYEAEAEQLNIDHLVQKILDSVALP